MDYYQNFRAQLEAKEKEQNKRSIKVYEPIDAVRVKRNNQEFIMMASNNYLGLTHDLRVQQAAKYNMELVLVEPDLHLVHSLCLTNWN